MTVNSLSAMNAYQNQLKLAQQAGDGTDDADASGGAAGGSFASLIESAVKDAANTQFKAESTQMQSITGKVELTDLVTAVANAELSLNTVVAVRDRVINAYQDIIKMSI